LASVPHLKPPALNLACSCAAAFTYAVDRDWATLDLGAIQGAGRWTCTSDR